MSNADLTGLPPANWNILPVARVAPLMRQQAPPLGRLALWIIRHVEKTTGDYNVFGTLARLGSTFPAQAIFLSQLLKRGRLARAEKEQVILRTAWRLGAVYEYGHHHLRARQSGLTDAAIAAATTEDAADQITRNGAFLAAADELLATHTLSDEAFTTRLEVRLGGRARRALRARRSVLDGLDAAQYRQRPIRARVRRRTEQPPS